MHLSSARIALGSLCAMTLVSCASDVRSRPADMERESSARSSSLYPQPDWSKISGSLVRVSMTSTVGVVLDDFAGNQREQLAQSLSRKPQSFWVERAKRQMRLRSLKANFRYGGGKKQLPLAPESLWQISIEGQPHRQKIDGHDVLAVGYDFSAILLSDIASPGESEPALAEIGGTWEEPFLFPVDPEFIFQRTGFACMNESEFPPNSMDSEESDLFYDPRCKVEKKLTNIGCHQTIMPKMSCVDALTANIGKVETVTRFERLPWNTTIADQVRLGEFTNPDGPDLKPNKEGFLDHRFTYRYIPGNSCTLVEKCVGGPGWRQLLQFPTGDINIGTKVLEIGRVDYFHQENGTTLSDHGVFEFSDCHHHYHFSHYGSFTLGDGSEAISQKNGFCMQPTARLMNNELSPLHHPYVDCIDQGVSVGWIDEYKMGLECQWIDVTDVTLARDLPLSFTTNPEGFLCEGKLRLDAEGKQLFEPTTYTTSAGKPVEAPQCDEYPEWAANNTIAYQVHIPEEGDSYVTEKCREGLFGPLRNCGLTNTKTLSECRPGKKVTMSCEVATGSPAQIIRFCEGSRALKTGLPCTYNDALASATIDGTTDITFTCPSARDAVETGGSYSFLSGALFPGEKEVEVRCAPKLTE